MLSQVLSLKGTQHGNCVLSIVLVQNDIMARACSMPKSSGANCVYLCYWKQWCKLCILVLLEAMQQIVYTCVTGSNAENCVYLCYWKQWSKLCILVLLEAMQQIVYTCVTGSNAANCVYLCYWKQWSKLCILVLLDASVWCVTRIKEAPKECSSHRHLQNSVHETFPPHAERKCWSVWNLIRQRSFASQFLRCV
jgi:hypothetical protein